MKLSRKLRLRSKKPRSQRRRLEKLARLYVREVAPSIDAKDTIVPDYDEVHTIGTPDEPNHLKLRFRHKTTLLTPGGTPDDAILDKLYDDAQKLNDRRVEIIAP